MSDKKKLTLSINSEVIEKAKKLGLNLSEITERALKLSSLNLDEDNIATPDMLREGYVDVLKKTSKILEKWGMHLLIGSYVKREEFENSKGITDYIHNKYEYILSPNEVYLWADFSDDEPLKTWQFDDEKLPVNGFNDPEKIIIDLVDELYDKANKNKEILDKLQILKNILELSNLTK